MNEIYAMSIKHRISAKRMSETKERPRKQGRLKGDDCSGRGLWQHAAKLLGPWGEVSQYFARNVVTAGLHVMDVSTLLLADRLCRRSLMTHFAAPPLLAKL